MIIKRYGPPGILDTSEHKTKCIVDCGNGIDLYIQRSRDTERPNWEFLGTFSEEELEQKLENF